MKTPKFIFRDKELGVSRHEIKSYDDERIRCFLMSPKSRVEKAPCLIYILGDVIDRNNLGGVDILKWLLLRPNVQHILGNHEQMLLSNRWVFQEISDESIDNIEENNIELLKL